MNQDIITSTLSGALRAGTPLLFATLGEILAERSGVLNLGLEGMMLMGAFTGFSISYITGNLWLAVIAAVLVGGLMASLHAFMSITLRINQVVSGLALVFLGEGLSGFWGKSYVGLQAASFSNIKIPFFGDIPYVGPIVFDRDILVYIGYIAVPVIWWFLYKTKAGMNLRAVGESPEAADARGINVVLTRYNYTIVGGFFSGLAGAYITLAYTPMWVQDITAGRGWIAVALVIFAIWDPVIALIGAYAFGGISVLQFSLQIVQVPIPVNIMNMFPYLFTIFIMLFASSNKIKKRFGAPSALGVPYSREEKT
jgi:ABC-type uncharacterized transport system permease subunit